jgi:Protein of unknown function (DUF2384)
MRRRKGSGQSLRRTTGVRPAKPQTVRKTQTHVNERCEIIARIAEWAGSKHNAWAWYRAEPIPAFGGRTAEFLVKEGKADAVRDYLDHLAAGGFA